MCVLYSRILLAVYCGVQKRKTRYPPFALWIWTVIKVFSFSFCTEMCPAEMGQKRNVDETITSPSTDSLVTAQTLYPVIFKPIRSYSFSFSFFYLAGGGVFCWLLLCSSCLSVLSVLVLIVSKRKNILLNKIYLC